MPDRNVFLNKLYPFYPLSKLQRSPFTTASKLYLYNPTPLILYPLVSVTIKVPNLYYLQKSDLGYPFKAETLGISDYQGSFLDTNISFPLTLLQKSDLGYPFKAVSLVISSY